MKEKWLKYIFIIWSSLLLILMLLMSRYSGVSCDEVLHYDHSVSVYNYYASHGQDKSALNTPVSHLQYYGQSYDNVLTILTRWFGIEDVYGFRNIMSPLAGWLTILITAIFAVWLSGWWSGIIVLLLFAVSPTFLGHSQNNLKDIPFALGYISGIYFTLRYILSEKASYKEYSLLLTLAMAFCISIRIGGLILICYLFLFLVLYWIMEYLKERSVDFRTIRNRLLTAVVISMVSYFLSLLLWPYALQNPIVNPLKSYQVMLQYPDTFRQIFEGKVEWSDFMPWYYLLKYMAITIPIIVLAGLLLFLLFSKKIFNSGKLFIYSALVFTIIFPVIFVILERSNLYSAWRHFLFIYPGIILISAIGFFQLFKFIRKIYLVCIISVFFTLISIHPLKFMILNPTYSYIYYNQFVGGLNGAYGKYETDYYFVSLKEGSEWLIKYLEEKKITGKVKVRSNFSVKWFFRNHPEIDAEYFRNEERSQYDWDYAIITNRYIPIYQLNNKTWPPENAIKIFYADKVPVCAVLERKSKDDFLAYEALQKGRTKEALILFDRLLKKDSEDEMIYYNFASALFDDMQFEKADSALKKCLEINPDFDLALMFLGNISKAQNRRQEAVEYYKKVINVNRKYLEAYVELAGILMKDDVAEARDLLVACLNLNPRFKPAIISMADTYRTSDPEVAKKYDELAKTIK